MLKISENIFEGVLVREMAKNPMVTLADGWKIHVHGGSLELSQISYRSNAIKGFQESVL